jgi:tight adherence protein C
VNLEIMMVVGGALLFAAFFAVLTIVGRQTVDLRGRVGSWSTLPQGGGWKEVLKKLEALFKPLGEMIPRSPEEMSRQEKRLVQAGIRRKDAAVLFLGAQVGLASALLLTFAATGYLARHVLLFAVLSIFLGALLPDAWLKHRIANRMERIQLALPDALDLAVVCVEAGLGLDQSLIRIAEEIRITHPDLADEFRLRNLEINMGRSRADAFRNLAARAGCEDMKSLVAILIQTDRFGTSIGQSLRVFCDSLRTKRRQRAEERAAKLSVKMIPPMVLFIFPAIFVVVAGPAVIAIARNLLPYLRQ